MRGQFPHWATPQRREHAGGGRPFALCIVRAMLSHIDSDPLQPRQVDPSQHFCPNPDCDYRGWVGWGNLSSNGHPSGGPWRQLYCSGSVSKVEIDENNVL